MGLRNRSRSAARLGHRVLVTCPTFEPGFRGGGPVRSISQIVDGAPSELDLILVTADRDLGSRVPYPSLSGCWVPRGQTSVYYLGVHSLRQWFSLIAQLRTRRISLIYVNSLWEPYFSLVPILLAVLHVLPAERILVAPRGELSCGALAIKARRKRWFISIWRHVLLHAKAIWHASTEMEAYDIRALFPNANIIVCVDRPLAPALHPPSAAKSLDSTSIKFVFIGRIAEIKNLNTAILALSRVTTPAVFDIYGPIEDVKYWAECQRSIASLPSHIQVAYAGELAPDRVVPTFAAYDAFIFPTRGENFGHVIAESLSAACPVICSDQTSWTSVLEGGGGTVVRDATPVSLGEVLAVWARRPRPEIAELSSAARAAFVHWSEELDGQNILELALQRIDGRR